MQREERELTDLDEPSLGAMNLANLDDTKRPPTNSTTSSGHDEAICVACGFAIVDRYIYKVMNESYHEHCLRCACCSQPLGSSPTCYSKHGSVYCHHDHQMLFGKRCRRCSRHLQPTDIVYKVHYMLYHSSCFSCFACQSTFSKGDEYFYLDGEIFCRNDYQSLCQLHAVSADNNALYEDAAQNEINRKTPKRPRTILNAQQRKQFKAAFDKSSKPSRKVREQLAKETGLSVRVVQVWFQNQRAKMKKVVRKDGDSNSEVFKTGTNSEGRSTEDMRSSDDEESIFNLDSEELDLEKPASVSESNKAYTNPIQKLYNMTSSQIYFPYST